MKGTTIFGVLLATLLVVGCATVKQSGALKPSGTLAVKTGDTLYVCPCGSTCECQVVALKEAKCGCGHDLTKVTVTEVKGNQAHFLLNGKAQMVSLTGKYACACGSGCCQMISNKAGKCACGKDMVEVAKIK